MSAIGKRVINLFVGADVTFYRPATADTVTVYWSNRSWITNPNDTIAANRQFVGLLLQGHSFDYSWFRGDQLGGRSERNDGALRAINADGAHSLDYIFDGGYSVQGQPITFYLGEVGDDLGAMIRRTVQGRHVRQSEDGFEVVIDLSDAGQALDTSILIDRFQGLGRAVRFGFGEFGEVTDDVSLDPATAWHLDVAYRLPPWANLSGDLLLAWREAVGGVTQSIELLTTGKVRVKSCTTAPADVTVTATDLDWVADGRWHRVAGRWNGALLEAWHSTRTGGQKSAVSAAQVTCIAGSGDLEFGDVTGVLGTNDRLDVAEVRYLLDANVPTDAEVIETMKRRFTDDEGADCEVWLPLDEGTGLHAFDESVTNVAASGTLTVVTLADTNTVTIDGKVYTFQDTLTNVDGNVKRDADDSISIDNLIAAVNIEAGSGTLYAAATTLHATVSASAGAGDTMTATAKVAGLDGNAIAVSETLTDGSWAAATLLGGVGHTATLPADSWVPTFEGTADLAGQAKPVSWGYAGANMSPTWSDRGEGVGVVHARGFKGAFAAYEGANRLVIGWPQTKFLSVIFDAATDTISFADRVSPAGVTRYDAQPGFAGLVDLQKVVIAGTVSNNGTKTLNGASSINSIPVAESLTDEGPIDCWITALDAASGLPDVELYFHEGGVRYAAVPTLPVSFELLGDYGADLPTDDTSVHFPEYAAAIMRRILEDWAGVAAANIADNWDTDPVNPIGTYWKHAGIWDDPGNDHTIRSTLDELAAGLWPAWGQDPVSGDWDLYVITDPAGAEDVALDSLSILNLRRIKSVEPIGGLTLRCAINYAQLKEGEVAGVADADTAAELRRPWLEARAAIDPDVALAYPFAATPAAINTCLRNLEDARAEAQRRYDLLKVPREMYHAEVILYGLNKNPLSCRVNLTDADFPTLEAGKDCWMVRLDANDEAVTMTTWG